MKFSALALSFLLATSSYAENHDHTDECTHGLLFFMDDTSSDVHMIDTSHGVSANMQVQASVVSLPAQGAGALAVYGPPADPLIIQYRGVQPNLQGYVRTIDSGFRFDPHGDHAHVEYVAPSIYANANIDECRQPVHQVRNNDEVAIFCDGAYNAVPQVNATVHVIDESLLGRSGSAVSQSVTLEGAHHGVAIPVDDGHLLHSLALEDRVMRVPDASSLPSTFQVIDPQGNILHSLSDTSNPDTHCSGFHGSANIGNTFFLGCDDVHGGIVVVQYDPASMSYTSRAMLYPDDAQFDGLRIGSFAYHYHNPVVVGSYSIRGGSEFHLVAIPSDATSLSTDLILTLPGNARQCDYKFEVGHGEHLYVFMPDGVLHVFEVDETGFTAVAQKTIVEGMVTCDEAVFTAGITQAFVATPADKKLYSINLLHVEDGEMDVYETTLPVAPVAMTVSGFSLEAACEEEHEHGNPAAAPSGPMMSTVIGLLVVVVSYLF